MAPACTEQPTKHIISPNNHKNPQGAHSQITIRFFNIINSKVFFLQHWLRVVNKQKNNNNTNQFHKFPDSGKNEKINDP